MGIKTTRGVIEQRDRKGKVKFKALSIPPGLETQDKHAMAADAVILSDPTGVLTEEELYKLLQEKIEPVYWEKRKKQLAEEIAIPGID